MNDTATNGTTALAIEKAVADMMRGARDDKIRLETQVAEQAKLIEHLYSREAEMQQDFKEQITLLIDQGTREHAQARADLTAMQAERDAAQLRATTMENYVRSALASFTDVLRFDPAAR